MVVWFKTKPRANSESEKWGGGVPDEVEDVRLVPELAPYRLPPQAGPPVEAVIVPSPCRECKEPWCNFPEMTKMEVTKFDNELDFRKLPQYSSELDELPFLVDDPTLIDSIVPLNRYRNISPNPRTLVRLQALDDDPVSTYINANFVAGALGNPNQYIAAQGPLQDTAWDFWRMVWEQRSNVIIMTTGLVEGDRNKCFPYWPQEEGEMMQCKYETPKGSALVWFTLTNEGIEESVDGKYVKTTILIRKGGEEDEDSINYDARTVEHFWYNTWPDHGVPDDYGAVVGMLNNVRSVSNGQPWVVHCSAGVGRTGSFIGIDIGMDLLKRYGKVDVLDLVTHMRKCRGQSVQSPQQALFVFWTLEQFAAQWNKAHQSGVLYCPRCPFETKDAGALATHAEEHNRPTFECPVEGCSFTTEDEGDLEEHADIHKPPEFKCPHCAFKSTDEEAVDEHVLDHLQHCPLCDFSAYSKAEMDEHEVEEHDVGEELFSNFIPMENEDKSMIKYQPKWLHGPMHREESDALLVGDDGLVPGSFLLKRLHEINMYELACVPSGGNRVSHHKITRDKETGYISITVAKGAAHVPGPYSSINEMLAAFSKKHPRWPLVLSAYVPCHDKGWGDVDGVACTCAHAVADFDGTGRRIDRRTGPHIVPFLRRATFEDSVPQTISDSSDLPRWSNVPRQMAELLVTFGGAVNGTWLLRELTKDKAGMCVVYEGEASHHLIHRMPDGSCQLNGVHTRYESIDEVIEVLQVRPRALQWPIKLEMSRLIRPWAIGNVVSAPYSADGKYYDGIIVDIFPSGNFRDIPVDLARVSYVGYASDNDDCVPINLLRPPTGTENPDFYTPGGLNSAVESGIFTVGEDDEVKQRRLTLLHEEALAREIVVDVSDADMRGLDLDTAGEGTYVVGVQGSLAEGGQVYPGLQVVRIENTDTEAAQPDLVKMLTEQILQTRQTCEVAFKVNPPGFADIVKKRTGAATPAAAAAGADDTRITVNPTFDVSQHIIYAVPGDAKSHGLKWLPAPENSGCFIRSVKMGSPGHGVVSEGLRLVSVDDVDTSRMAKTDVVKTIRAARANSGGAVTLAFVEDRASFEAARSAEAAPAAAAAAPLEARGAASGTKDVLISGADKLGISFVTHNGHSFVSKVKPGGAAEATGLVSVGDMLVKINGEDVSKVTKDDRNAAIRRAQATGNVLMTFGTDVAGFEAALEATNKAKEAKAAKPPAVPASTVDVVFKEQTKLGLSFVGRDGYGNWVSKVKEGGAADATGLVKAGHRLLAVNGVDVSTAPKAERNMAIKQGWSVGQLTLTFGEDLEGYQLALAAKADEAAAAKPQAAKKAVNEIDVVFTEQVKLGISFTVVDGRGNFVSRVRPGMAADGTGKIKVGHKLMAVNGTDLSTATGVARTAAIKAAWTTGTLTMRFCDDPDGWKLALQQKEREQATKKAKEAGGKAAMSDLEVAKRLMLPGEPARHAADPELTSFYAPKDSKAGAASKEKGVVDAASAKSAAAATNAKPKKGSRKESQDSKKEPKAAKKGSPKEGGSAKRPAAAQSASTPAGAQLKPICAYANATTGQKCKRIASGGSDFCANHTCPSCNKAKGSREPTCKKCEGGSQTPVGPNPYLDMDRREVMKLLRQAKVPYDRAMPLEGLAELALKSL